MNNLQRALSWFTAAPARFYDGASARLEAMAEWIWTVLQGDFADEQSTSQMVTGTVISMIPLVDQICDVRDVVANCHKLREDVSNKWAWVALALTLIGLFPTLGSLVKGSFKILFAYGRKALLGAGKAALDADLWKTVAPYVEAGIRKLNDFLARPEVAHWLSKYHIDNPYRHLATELRKVAAKVNVGSLLSAFDEGISTLARLLDKVQRWGGKALGKQAGQLIESIRQVRRAADARLVEALAPVQRFLDRLANRLELEHAVNHRAMTNAVNPHQFTRMSLDVEVELLKKAPPAWLRVGKRARNKALEESPAVPPGFFDIGKNAEAPLRMAYETFSDIRPDRLSEGTVIYRVLDPKSTDNSICWMTEQEFKKLHTKMEWRESYAVWVHWNGNGEYVKYTVPEGGLPVWRGTTASQQLKDRAGNVVNADDRGNSFWLVGGAEQIVVDPARLKRSEIGKREFTGWTDGDTEIEVNLVGVPSLVNWRN